MSINITTYNANLTNFVSTSTLIATNSTCTNLFVTNTTMTNLVLTSNFIKGTSTTAYLSPMSTSYYVAGQTGNCTIASFSVPAYATTYIVNLAVDVTAWSSSGTANARIEYTSSSGQFFSEVLQGANYGISYFTTQIAGAATARSFNAYTITCIAGASTTFRVIITSYTGTWTYNARCILQQVNFA